ncbi:hypothetical protein [Confluentibacter lentus]|uniref:hypothetical protein n=1 Tax=Confluentibacter lentus TaxID=1699412 RepID=UPI0012FD6168|nr:hypothetical protein [Confluentibacter lentus]
MLSLTKINVKEYRFIVFFLFFELIFTYALSFSNMHAFSLVPFKRIGTILFCFVFFINDFLNLKIKISRISRIFKVDFLMLFWFVISCTALIIGLFNKNPLLYIITDSVYVFFGSILFYIVRSRPIDTVNLNNSFFNKISNVLIIISVLYLFFGLELSSVLMVVMVVLLYINLLKKNYLYAILISIPYFLIVVSSNRTQVIVLFIMILILILRSSRKYFSIKSVVLFAFALSIFLFLIKVQILEGLLTFINPSSNIGYRINQVLIIFKYGIDYSNPFFTSITQRLLEAQAVLTFWTQDIFSFFFGAGSGGVINGAVFYKDASVLGSALLGSEKVHNIHLLPFALIFRYGIFGLILLVNILIMTYKSFVLVLNEKEDFQKIFCNLFFVFWVIYSMPAASFLWTMPLFWILYGCLNNIEIQRRNYV